MSNNPDIREVEEEAAGSIIELGGVHIVASIDPTDDDDAQMAKADVGPEGEIASNGIGIAEKKGCGKFLEWLEGLLGDKDKVQWVENMRGSLSMAISIIAAITFQVATNPPGGVVQAGPNDKFNPSNNTCDDSKRDSFCPGHAVLAIVYPDGYLLFLKYNTTSFIASLSVCLMLVSGLPLKHRLVVWFLCMLMCVAITALAFTYIYAAALVTPNNILDTANSVLTKVLKIWGWLLWIVAFLLILRLLVWVVNKLLLNCNYKILTKRLFACLFCKSECLR